LPALSHTPTAVRTPSMSHTPTTASLAMTDLWDELKHCRSGEDNHTIIERHRERHRNLDGDYGGANVAPVGHTAHTPASPGSGGGYMALAPHIWMVVWPRKFRPHLLEKYDGTINPTEFLQIYSTFILAAGGNEAVMANYFPVALIGMTRSWLMSYPIPRERERSLHTCAQDVQITCTVTI
jgi:hypothetical protein